MQFKVRQCSVEFLVSGGFVNEVLSELRAVKWETNPNMVCECVAILAKTGGHYPDIQLKCAKSHNPKIKQAGLSLPQQPKDSKVDVEQIKLSFTRQDLADVTEVLIKIMQETEMFSDAVGLFKHIMTAHPLSQEEVTTVLSQVVPVMLKQPRQYQVDRALLQLSTHSNIGPYVMARQVMLSQRGLNVLLLILQKSSP